MPDKQPTGRKPSSAGVCAECGKYAEKRYGGEGRYLVVCLDCWLKGEPA